jgi:2-dehydropantoate 2-reductase
MRHGKGQRMKVLIYGAGAIGSWLGAEMTRQGLDVTLLARGANLAALKQHGVTLTRPDGQTQTTPVQAVAPTDPLGSFDLVIVTLKSMQLAAAAHDLMARLSPNGSLLMIQNGLPWWYFEGLEGPWRDRQLHSLDPEGTLQRMIPTSRVVGAVIVRPVIQTGAARYLVPDFPKSVLRLGEISGGTSGRLQNLCTLLSPTLPCEPVADIRQAKWTKLMRNMIWNTLCALSQSGPDRFAQNTLGRQLVHQVAHEGLSVARSIGQALHLDVEAELSSVLDEPGHTPSMLQDVRAGRALETDAILRAVIEIGRWTQTETPTLHTLCALLEVMQAAMLAQGKGVGYL